MVARRETDLGCLWRKAAAKSILRDRARQHELQQIVGAASLAADARELEAAERLAADHGAGAGTVEIKIADHEFSGRAIEIRRATRIDAAGQSEFRVICDGDRLRQIFCAND